MSYEVDKLKVGASSLPGLGDYFPQAIYRMSDVELLLALGSVILSLANRFSIISLQVNWRLRRIFF